jgi:hypothetical protein
MTTRGDLPSDFGLCGSIDENTANLRDPGAGDGGDEGDGGGWWTGAEFIAPVTIACALLAVLLAVLGVYCCSKKYARPNEFTSADSSEMTRLGL